VVVVWQSYNDNPELNELGIITKQVLKDCRETLLAFRSRIDKKYRASLGLGGSGSWLQDASKKVIWVKEKEDILELRQKLQTSCDMITMLSLAAMG
jgi:2'-5' RNA ligase